MHLIEDLCKKVQFVSIKKGAKAPIGKGWQQGGTDWKTAWAILNQGKNADGIEVGAIGVLCGSKSGGLLMVDHDGESCDRLLQEWGVELPEGPIVSSGRLGHYQQPFWVPEIYWEGVRTAKFKTGVNGPDGKPELLELRWDGCQSVVLGTHPDPGKIYTWTNEQLPIPMAPLELLEKMLPPQKQPKSASTLEGLGDKERALSYLGFIDPNPLDWYTWRDCLFACHSAGLNESEVLNWSERSAAHTERGFGDVWRHIKGRPGVGIGTLGYLAKLNGWTSSFVCSQPIPPVNGLTESATPAKEGFEAYLEKLKNLNEIVDPIRKGYEVFAVSKADGYPLRQIESALNHYRQRQGSKDKTVFELDEFLDLPFAANSWLIDGLVPCGETLILAGAPKEGKTLVAFDAAYSVATNRSKFLGIQPSKKGRVLLISSDESPRSTQDRLKKRGFTADDRGQIRIITRFNLQNLSELRDQLADFQPDLTIVDSLKSISQGSEVSENSAEFADSIYALKELFTQYDSAAILIHHTNKDRDAQGVAQVRGSTAIAGAVWGVFVLKTPKRRQGEEPPKDRWLEVNPREGERRTLSIELDPSVNTWAVIGSTEQTSPDQATAKERVIALLKGMAGKGLEFSEIRDLLPDIKRETLSTTLNRLVDSGIAGKRQSETNYKSWVYWMVSSVVSHGFMPLENMVSSVVSHPHETNHETDHETERNGCQTKLSEVGFTNAPPRVVSQETNMVSPLVSDGFNPVSEDDDIDWEVSA
jgi:DNA-binding HxlR family transcriptional regulator